MHRERLDFKLEIHLNQTVRPAVSHHLQLLTIAAPFHTQYILNSMIMDMCSPHPFQVKVAQVHNVMHSTTTVRGHRKLVRGHKWPLGPHLAIPVLYVFIVFTCIFISPSNHPM